MKKKPIKKNLTKICRLLCHATASGRGVPEVTLQHQGGPLLQEHLGLRAIAQRKKLNRLLFKFTFFYPLIPSGVEEGLEFCVRSGRGRFPVIPSG